MQPHRQQPTRLPVPGILQARTLEWVVISFSNVWKWKVKVKSLTQSCLTLWDPMDSHQAPPSVGFSRQEYWSGVPLPWPDIKPRTPALGAWSLSHWANSNMFYFPLSSFSPASLKNNWPITWCKFNIYCVMMTTIRLVNTSVTSHSYLQFMKFGIPLNLQ